MKKPIETFVHDDCFLFIHGTFSTIAVVTVVAVGLARGCSDCVLSGAKAKSTVVKGERCGARSQKSIVAGKKPGRSLADVLNHLTQFETPSNDALRSFAHTSFTPKASKHQSNNHLLNKDQFAITTTYSNINTTMSLRETFLTSLSLTPKSPAPSNTSKVDQFYSQFVGNALAIMQYRSSMTLKEQDIRHAASTMGFTIPENVELQVKDDFKSFTHKVLTDDFQNGVPIEDGAYKLLQVIYDAASNGTVSSTPSKEGITYKLESPTGVNANLFSRNFQDVDDDNDDDEELEAQDEEDESDEELEADEEVGDDEKGGSP